jgi:tetratricopeptide (TPR) repeat protein
MKCKVPERQIYHLCDGLLPEEDRAALEAHVAACGRCGRVYRDARATLDILKHPAPAYPLIDDTTARAAIERGLELGRRPTQLIEFAPKKLPPRFLAAAAVFVFAALSLMYLALGLQSRNRPTATAGTNPASQESAISTSIKDTIVIFNRMCALKVCPNSNVTIIQPRKRIVHIGLGHGSVLVAAHKGLYDTIAVRCGAAVTVFATGTHFSVDRSQDEVRVSVIEGTVTVRNGTTGGQTAVACGELCLADGASGSLSTGPLPRSLHLQLAEDFEALGPWAFPLASPQRPGTEPQLKSAADLAAAQHAYAAARRLVRRGEYDSAISAIVKYLSVYSLDRDVAYCDLALCYSKSGRWESALDAYQKALAATEDSLVHEAVLHRSNSILFSKLARFDKAEQGIRDYLESYPIGAWREREYGMLVKIELAQKRRSDAAQTVDAFQSEFPVACSVEEMRLQIAQLPADSAAQAGRHPGR